jgi:hypothetical protein
MRCARCKRLDPVTKYPAGSEPARADRPVRQPPPRAERFFTRCPAAVRQLNASAAGQEPRHKYGQILMG